MRKPSRWRLPALLVISALVSTLTMVSDPVRTAQAVSATWPVGLDAKQVVGQLLAHPDGPVSVSGCRYRDDPTRNHDLTTIKPGSSIIGVVGSPADHQIDFCKKWSVSGPGGVTYVVDWQPSTNKNHVIAFRGGTRLWSTKVSSDCASYVGSGRRGMVAGSDGGLYLALEECGELIVVGLTSKGTVKFTHNLGYSQDYGNQAGGVIMAYRDGFVVLQNNYHNGHATQIRYFDFAGRENISRRFSDSLLPNEVYGEWGISFEGKLSIAINRRIVREQPCAVPWLTHRVVTFGAATSSVSMSSRETEHLCLLAGQVEATPDGSVAIVHDRTYDFDLNHVPQKISPLYVIDVSGKIHLRPLPLAPGMSEPHSRASLRVGLNGNLMLHRWVKREQGSRQISVSEWILLDPAGAELARFSSSDLLPTSVEGDTFAIPSNDLWTLTNGVLYAVMCDTTLDTQRGCESGGAKLYKVPFVEASFDYLTGRVQGARTPRVTTIDLIGAGDSFTSAEGNGPFDPSTDKEGNQCHRSSASYVHQLAQSPKLPIRLQAFVACSGATSKHLVEPNTDNQEPAQVNAITKGTRVAVMTFGGNDINFELFSLSCMTTDCTITAPAFMGLINQNLGDKLLARLRAVKKANPSARIVMAGYPYMLPTLDRFRVSGLECGLITADEVLVIRELIRQLNAAIKKQVRRAGITFVSVAGKGSPFEGHELCSDGESYFNGLRAPKEYSLHPNKLGHERGYAPILEEAIRKMI